MSTKRRVQQGERLVVRNDSPQEIVVTMAPVAPDVCTFCGAPARILLFPVDMPDHKIGMCTKHYDHLKATNLEGNPR